jgi:hypothetical protein
MITAPLMNSSFLAVNVLTTRNVKVDDFLIMAALHGGHHV